ncbi:MAG: sigma-70 family RNA polymerase sigma factor [Oscillospiraceae bacterium]|nr:sigma-70 family RNA polymerase sigma factor [Oscillospiraceae bacterium]
MTDIVALLEARDERALQLLKDEYSNYCYTILYGILRDHGETEEALNDLWLRVWNSVPPAKPRCLRAYLAKVSRNIALDRLKFQGAKKRGTSSLPLDEIAEILPSRLSETEQADLRDVLNRFVKALPTEEQRIFLRRYWYNETVEELAEAFHCSQSRITGILFRTRKKLRKFLKKEGYPYE